MSTFNVTFPISVQNSDGSASQALSVTVQVESDTAINAATQFQKAVQYLPLLHYKPPVPASSLKAKRSDERL